MNCEREWWRDMTPEEVLDRAKALPQPEVLALLSEIKAACATMAMRSQDKTFDPDMRRQATRALAWTVRKKQLLKALVQRTYTEGFDHKRDRVETMLDTVETTADPLEAVRLLAATMRAMWGME